MKEKSKKIYYLLLSCFLIERGKILVREPKYLQGFLYLYTFGIYFVEIHGYEN